MHHHRYTLELLSVLEQLAAAAGGSVATAGAPFFHPAAAASASAGSQHAAATAGLPGGGVHRSTFVGLCAVAVAQALLPEVTSSSPSSSDGGGGNGGAFSLRAHGGIPASSRPMGASRAEGPEGAGEGDDGDWAGGAPGGEGGAPGEEPMGDGGGSGSLPEGVSMAASPDLMKRRVMPLLMVSRGGGRGRKGRRDVCV